MRLPASICPHCGDPLIPVCSRAICMNDECKSGYGSERMIRTEVVPETRRTMHKRIQENVSIYRSRMRSVVTKHPWNTTSFYAKELGAPVDRTRTLLHEDDLIVFKRSGRGFRWGIEKENDDDQ